MDLAASMEKAIEKKKAEIAKLENELLSARSFLSGLQESLRLVKKGGSSATDKDDDGLRPGSVVALAREAILTAGRALHISDIAKALGKADDPKTRVSLAGSIASYARRGKVFTKEGANVYGLKELAASGEGASNAGN